MMQSIRFVVVACLLSGSGSLTAQQRVAHHFYGDLDRTCYGIDVNEAGDVNNDGFEDFVVGAWFDSTTAKEAGSARVISGKDGVVLYTFYGLQADDYLGISVSTAGDVDGDNHDDLLIGSYVEDFSPTNPTANGYAQVFSGATGQLIYHLEGDQAADMFGLDVSGGFDLDNDDVPDFIIGAYQGLIDGTGPDRQRGYIRTFSGATGNILHTVRGQNSYDQLGTSVSGVGDVNGDGHDDYIGAAASVFYFSPNSGYVRMYSGLDGSVLYEVRPERMSQDFGICVGDTEDVDGDGINDFIVGTPNQAGFPSPAVAQVFSGVDGTLIVTLPSGPGGGATILPGPRLDFAIYVDGLGDLDHDGHPEIAIGSRYDRLNGARVGSVRVFSSKDWTERACYFGNQVDMDFGQSVASLDLDGDGQREIIVGSPMDSTTEHLAGSVTVLEFPAGDTSLQCGERIQSYGSGCAGEGGVTPALKVTGCPEPFGWLDFEVSGGLGGARALIVVGVERASLKLNADHLFLNLRPILMALDVVLSGSGPGQGSFQTGGYLAGPGLVTLQTFVFDNAAPLGLSSSSAVEIRVP
jgi:hypothetical protein